MSEVSFQVFKHPKDHYKWHKLREYAKLTPDIADEVKKDWIDALTFLENELGKGFLKSCTNKHPLFLRLIGKALWQVEYLISFSNTLKKLQVIESNYPKLIEKLKSIKRCESEGIPFVDSATSLLKEGFLVEFPDESQKGKCPDIKLINPENNEVIYIEVSRLEDSDKYKKSYKSFNILHEFLSFYPPRLLFSCKQLEEISDDIEMEQIIQKLQEIKQQANDSDTFLYYKDDKIELGIAPHSRKEEFTIWIQEKKGRQYGVTGVSLDFAETKRIVNNKKIKQEAEQLPEHAPGLIYMPVNPLYFQMSDLDEAISMLENELKPFPNVIGLVLYALIGDPVKDEAYQVNGHFYGKKMLNELTLRHLLFVYNHHRTVPVSKQSLDKIYQSFQ